MPTGDCRRVLLFFVHLSAKFVPDLEQACVSGSLSSTEVKFAADMAACAVVVVTKDYPHKADKGRPITG